MRVFERIAVMKRPGRTIFVLAVWIVVMLIAGCGEPEPPSVKKSRLIAAESMQLRKELGRRGKEIERLKQVHNEEIEKQKKLLAKCLEEKEGWKQKARQNVRNQVKGVFDAIMEQNAKLREENEKLEGQIGKLEAELKKRGESEEGGEL